MAISEITTLETIAAEHHLTQAEAQLAGPIVGQALLGLFETAGRPNDDHLSYELSDIEPLVCSISEQPDLTGSIKITIAHASVNWALLQLGPRGNRRMDYSALTIFGRDDQGRPNTTSTMLSVVGVHQKMCQRLFALPVPLDAECAGLYRFASPTQSAAHQPEHLISVRNSPHHELHPRRIAVAAALAAHIVGHNLQPTV